MGRAARTANPALSARVHRTTHLLHTPTRPPHYLLLYAPGGGGTALAPGGAGGPPLAFAIETPYYPSPVTLTRLPHQQTNLEGRIGAAPPNHTNPQHYGSIPRIRTTLKRACVDFCTAHRLRSVIAEPIVGWRGYITMVYRCGGGVRARTPRYDAVPTRAVIWCLLKRQRMG